MSKEIPTSNERVSAQELRDYADSLEAIDFSRNYESDIALWRRAADEIERLTRELETRTNSLKSIGESYAPLVQERERLRAALVGLLGHSWTAHDLSVEIHKH